MHEVALNEDVGCKVLPLEHAGDLFPAPPLWGLIDKPSTGQAKEPVEEINQADQATVTVVPTCPTAYGRQSNVVISQDHAHSFCNLMHAPIACCRHAPKTSCLLAPMTGRPLARIVRCHQTPIVSCQPMGKRQRKSGRPKAWTYGRLRVVVPR